LIIFKRSYSPLPAKSAHSQMEIASQTKLFLSPISVRSRIWANLSKPQWEALWLIPRLWATSHHSLPLVIAEVEVCKLKWVWTTPIMVQIPTWTPASKAQVLISVRVINRTNSILVWVRNLSKLTNFKKLPIRVYQSQIWHQRHQLTQRSPARSLRISIKWVLKPKEHRTKTEVAIRRTNQPRQKLRTKKTLVSNFRSKSRTWMLSRTTSRTYSAWWRRFQTQNSLNRTLNFSSSHVSWRKSYREKWHKLISSKISTHI